jgi:hypothetical protein
MICFMLLMCSLLRPAPDAASIHVKLDQILTELRELRIEFQQQRNVDNERWERMLPALQSLSRQALQLSPLPCPEGDIEENFRSPERVLLKRRTSHELTPFASKRLRFALQPPNFQKV